MKVSSPTDLIHGTVNDHLFRSDLLISGGVPTSDAAPSYRVALSFYRKDGHIKRLYRGHFLPQLVDSLCL